MHDDEHPAEATFQEAAKNSFPVFEIFAANPCQASEDLFAAVAAQTHNDVNAGGTKPIPVAKLDVLAIEEQGQQVAIQRAAVAQFQFFDQPASNPIQVLLRAGETHFL